MNVAMVRQRERGWWYPWIFVVGMLVVVAVNVVMITLALDTFPGLETNDAYRQGIAYNQTIAAAEAQAARGWHLNLAVEPQVAAGEPGKAERTAAVTATFTDRDGQPIGGLQVETYFVRPTIAGSDVTAELDELGNGRYAATVAVPLPGQWDVRIHARRGDDTYQATHRIMMP